MSKPSILVIGAGILGLWQAYTQARAGYSVRLIEESSEPFARAASRWAGAMIAPECEAEGAPTSVRDLGRDGLRIWREAYPGIICNGTLVVALARDAADLARFARLTERHETVGAARLGELEPMLGGRFERGLYFSSEAHLDAREALEWLLGEVRLLGAEIVFNSLGEEAPADITIDCRGIGARKDLPSLRGVRGERVLIHTRT